jgi:general secretion pathway protein H
VIPFRQGYRGFTLIELLVVLLLLGMIYALTGPMLDLGATGVDLKGASRQLAAGLRKARSMAIAGGHDAVLTVQVDSREFSVTGDPKVYKLPTKLDITLFTSQSEKLNGSTGSIRFSADGSSTGGRITVSAGTTKHSVDVDWVTGRVRIL